MTPEQKSVLPPESFVQENDVTGVVNIFSDLPHGYCSGCGARTWTKNGHKSGCIFS